MSCTRIRRSETGTHIRPRRDGDVDRMMARRLPNLVSGGWVSADNNTLRLLPKGRVIALGTLASFKLFSLGMGGGVK